MRREFHARVRSVGNLRRKKRRRRYRSRANARPVVDPGKAQGLAHLLTQMRVQIGTASRIGLALEQPHFPPPPVMSTSAGKARSDGFTGPRSLFESDGSSSLELRAQQADHHPTPSSRRAMFSSAARCSRRWSSSTSIIRPCTAPRTAAIRGDWLLKRLRIERLTRRRCGVRLQSRTSFPASAARRRPCWSVSSRMRSAQNSALPHDSR